MFCRPANSNIDPQIKYHNRHIDDIEHQRHQFQNKRSTSIACPRNRLKIDIPRNYKNIGGTKDKQRRKRCRNKIGHIGVNAQNPIGTKDKEQYNRKHKQICHTNTLIQRAPYIASISSSYQITNERTTCRRERNDNHKRQCRYVTNNIRYGQRSLAQMFHGDKKQEPCRHGYKILDHRPYRNIQNISQRFSIPQTETI